MGKYATYKCNNCGIIRPAYRMRKTEISYKSGKSGYSFSFNPFAGLGSKSKNKLFKYIILKMLKIDIDLLKKPLFSQFSLEIDFDRNFFYDYKKKIPVTKWMKMKNAYKFYQSNHDLEKYTEMKTAKKCFEELLNKEIKTSVFKK